VSQENVEILRAMYARWAHGDFWTPEVFDPAVEVVWSPDLPDMGTYRGLAGVEQSLREWFAAWGDMRLTAEEFIEVEADRILVLVSAHGRGPGSSGIAVVADDFAHDGRMRDGRATSLLGYASRAEALKAVGLEE